MTCLLRMLLLLLCSVTTYDNRDELLAASNDSRTERESVY